MGSVTLLNTMATHFNQSMSALVSSHFNQSMSALVSSQFGTIQTSQYESLAGAPLGIYHRFVNSVDPVKEANGPFSGLDLTEVRASALILYAWDPSTGQYSVVMDTEPLLSHLLNSLPMEDVYYGAAKGATYAQLEGAKWQVAPYGTTRTEFMPYMYGTQITELPI